MILGKSENSVPSAAIISTRELLHHVTHVDDVRMLLRRNGDPSLRWWVPDLQAFGPHLLKQYSDATEISVVAD